MRSKLNCVLLIDDDEPTNFLNEMIVREANCAERIVVVNSGQKALDFLMSEENGKHPQPDLIFLDINMPAMNGWDFLDAYKKLPEIQQAKLVIVMLTTSLNPEDQDRAEKIKEIDDFLNKPLTIKMLEEVLVKHFGDRLD